MAIIRSYLKVKPFKAVTKTGQNFNALRLSVNRIGGTTTGIGKSIESMYELLKFQNEFLNTTHNQAIETDKNRVKNKKLLKSKLAKEENKNTQKLRRDTSAKLAVDRGKKDAGKVEDKKKELKPVKTFLEKIAGFFSAIFGAFLAFGALDYIEKNADKIVKVIRLFVAIGKFAYKITKFGVFAVMDGLTNMFGDHSAKGIKENGVKRGLRFVFGFLQLTGGLLVLRYLTGPWRILTDIKFIIGAFSAVKETENQVTDQQERTRGGYFDKETGKFYSKQEYESMRRAQKPGVMGRGLNKVKGFGSKVSAKLGGGAGLLSAGMSVVGGVGRIMEGDREGEEKGTAVGAGVGKAVGGIAGTALGTAFLTPFLGPFAPIVGGFIGDFLGEFIGGQIGPLIEPIFGPIKRWFSMGMEIFKAVFDPLLKEVGPFFSAFFGAIGKVVGFVMEFVGPIMKFVGFVIGEGVKTIFKIMSFQFNVIKNIVKFAMNPIGFAWDVIRGKNPGDSVDLKQAANQKAAQQKPNVEQFAGGGKVVVPDIVTPKMMMGGPLGNPMMGMANPLATFDLVGNGLTSAILAGVNAFGFVAPDVSRVIAQDIARIQSVFGSAAPAAAGGTALGTLARSGDLGGTKDIKSKEDSKYESTRNILGGSGNSLVGLLKKAVEAAANQKSGGGSRSGGSSGTSSSGDGSDTLGSLPSGSVVDKGAGIARKLMSSLGMNAGAAAGMPGNFVAESTLVPNVREGGGTGHSWPAGRSGTPAGYGWAQWSFSRHDTFVNKFLGGFGGPGGASTKVATDEDNYKMLMYELKQPGGGFSPAHREREGMRQVRSLEDYKKITDPVEAARAFRTSWERADEGLAHDSVRIQNAKAIYEKIKSIGGLVEYAKGGRIRRSGRLGMGEPRDIKVYDEIEQDRSENEKRKFAAGGLLATNGSVADVRLTPQTPFSSYPLHHNKPDTHSYNNHRLGGPPIVPRDYVAARDWNNQGLDRGTPVVSGVDGKVVHASGHTVVIAKNGKDRMQFHHFDAIKTSVGQMVDAMTVIGLQGNQPSGSVHVHLDATPSDHRAFAAAQLGATYDPDTMKEGSSTPAGDNSSGGGGGGEPEKPDTIENRMATLNEALSKFSEAMKSGKAPPLDKGKGEGPKTAPAKANPEVTAGSASDVKSKQAEALQKSEAERKERERARAKSTRPTLVPVPINNGSGQQPPSSGGKPTKQIMTPTTPGLHR